MAQPPPPAPNLSSPGLWSDPSPLNLFPFIVTPIRSTDPKGGGWMSTEAIVTTPELYSIKSFTRTIIQSPNHGNGGGYNIEYGGWNFSFILKKVPPFPGFHLHVQNPSLPSAIRVVTVNATAVAGHSLSEVEGWCNGASVRMECVDDSSNIYTHVKNATKKQIQPESQSVAHPVEFGGGWVPPPPKEASSFTGIRSYDQGNRLPLTISTMLKEIRLVQTKRSESEKNKEEAISTANRIMVEYNMSQRDFVDLVIEVEGGDKDDVINFMNFGDGSSEEVYKLCCRLRTWIQSSGPTSPQHSNNNSSSKGCGRGLGVGVKVVSASKTSTSVVKAASPVARRGAPAPCGNCGEHGHSQLKCTKICRVFSGGGYQEGQAKGSREPSPKKTDGSFNLDNDDDSDASMFEDDEDLFDLEEVKRKIGAQRMDAKLNYGFPEDWDVYILKSSKGRRGSQRSNQQRNVVINYFIETPIGRQFRSLEKAKKYLQSLKRTIRPTRAKSSKSLKVDRTALTADRGSDFNPAADKARFSAIAAPAANATTTSKSRKMTKLVEKLSVGSNIRHKTLGHGVIIKISRSWLRGDFGGKKNQPFRITDLSSIEVVANEEIEKELPAKKQKRVIPTKTDDAVSLVGPSKNTSLLFVGTNVRHKTHGDGVVTIAKGKGWMIGEFDGEVITFRSTELELIEGVPVSSPPTSPAFKNTPKTALKKSPNPTPKQTCEPYNMPLSPKEISEGWKYIDPMSVGVPRTWRVKRIFYNNPVKTSFVIEARPSGKIFKSGKGARDYLKNLNVGVDGKATPHKCAKLISRPMDFEGGLKRKVFIETNPTSFGLSSKWRVVERSNGNKAKFYLSPEGCSFESQRNVQSYIEEMGGLDKIDKLELPPWIPPNTPASPPTPSNLEDSISTSTPPDPSSSSKADWTVSERMKDSELEKSKQCLSQNTAASNSPRPPAPLPPRPPRQNIRQS
ncbi:hypothetical protein TL16_g03007 [Triparma laevis f. inornata]|uniref:MBD domain-containing protein n=1 Tax=Triparma laevis f. inornata TaxID=1714386 RepID=A0A9W7DYX1_9STRA|nr:hypothetical protein TL16_g03007 [Triparma laevis f. inornata]